MTPLRPLSRLTALALAALLAMAPPLAAQQAEPLPQRDAGAYLAALFAAIQGDYDQAAGYYARALVRDPGNIPMQQTALVALIARGDLETARAMVQTMPEPVRAQLIPSLLQITAAAKEDDFQGVLALLPEAGTRQPGNDPEGNMLAALLRGWGQLGLGQMSAASGEFDRVIAQPGLSGLGRYHKALALASVGDFEGAAEFMTDEDGAPLGLGRRGILAHAQILSQLERADEAASMLDEILASGDDPMLQAARDRLSAGEALPFDLITRPSDGLAEVLFSFAGAMIGADLGEASGLIYARLAADLNPKNADAVIVAAGLLEQGEQYDLSIAAYDQVDPATPAGVVAQLGKANALTAAGREEEAVEVVIALSNANPESSLVWLTLGDLLRQTEAYDNSAAAYDRALDLMVEGGRDVPWFAYYARAIAHERGGDWALAEPDFRAALEQSPDQPEVLNYLGYSFVDRNENLDEALDLIRRAVAARPDDGYIQDSLAWAYFRLGRYDEAVEPMEAAVIRMSEDPLVNDHLGDVYWAVGRKREARVQWRRALSLVPGAQTEDEVDPDRIRRKLEVGLDQVRADEGAPPLRDE